jgi:hypothetical protein
MWEEAVEKKQEDTFAPAGECRFYLARRIKYHPQKPLLR